jgi:hypothetical protein
VSDKSTCAGKSGGKHYYSSAFAGTMATVPHLHRAPHQPSSRKFFIRANAVFLTFPALNGLTKDDVLKKLLEFWEDKLECVVIALEPYSKPRQDDATHHFHIAMRMKAKLRFQARHASFFDKICGYHGDYRPVPYKGGKKATDHDPFWRKVQYLYYPRSNKIVDPKPMTWPERFDPFEMIRAGQLKQNTRTAVILGMVRDSLDDEYWDYKIDDVFPEEIYRHRDLLEKYRDFKMERRAVLQRKLLDHIDYTGTCVNTAAICDWIKRNVCTGQKRMPHTRNLWIYGPPDKGKSWTIAVLRDFVGEHNIFTLGDNNNWTENYRNDRYDLLVIDEGDSTVFTPRFLKQIAGGQPMNLNRRGSRPMMKQDNPPMLVTANGSISDTYNKRDLVAWDLQALESRFEQVCVKELLDLSNVTLIAVVPENQVE